ncbi:hypothetical protein J5N97_019191 [Dioscorea zingiberensis]|uniref:Phytocyanin domain-containing protein n=1 Tax=Dioscorea zingiberensis TaxID=325984 RepID=A0A9D5CEJ6_9LILI|nr:hypothetical protein J5N97_019191 [Dioscorea zingiberensis]
MVAAATAATKHVVGGTATGWTIPPNTTFYSEWSASQTFAVGDSLVFNFPTGIHNVIKVPKSDYDACTTKNQIGATLSNGPATVTIPSGGQHYYLCGVGGHCTAGQKVSITVTGSASTEPTPAPASGGPAPAGSAGTTPPSTPAPATGPSAPAPQGPNSAAATLTGGCLVAFFSLAFASLI